MTRTPPSRRETAAAWTFLLTTNAVLWAGIITAAHAALT